MHAATHGRWVNCLGAPFHNDSRKANCAFQRVSGKMVRDAGFEYVVFTEKN